MEFDRIGNVRASVEGGPLRTGTYRIDGSTLIRVWSEKEEPNAQAYKVVGDTLWIDGIGSPNTFHRVPDDS